MDGWRSTPANNLPMMELFSGTEWLGQVSGVQGVGRERKWIVVQGDECGRLLAANDTPDGYRDANRFAP